MVTPLNGPVYRSLPQGGFGLEFDGIDDRVAVADDPMFVLTRSLTLEARIRVDALTDTHQAIVMRMDDRPGLDPYQMRVDAE